MYIRTIKKHFLLFVFFPSSESKLSFFSFSSSSFECKYNTKHITAIHLFEIKLSTFTERNADRAFSLIERQRNPPDVSINFEATFPRFVMWEQPGVDFTAFYLHSLHSISKQSRCAHLHASLRLLRSLFRGFLASRPRTPAARASIPATDESVCSRRICLTSESAGPGRRARRPISAAPISSGERTLEEYGYHFKGE